MKRTILWAIGLTLGWFFSAAAAADPIQDQLCERIKTGGVLETRVVFGYKDARPSRFVGDWHEKLAFVKKLTDSCTDSKDEACGFERHAENADFFSKLIRLKGGEPYQVTLYVVHSSVGTDDESNRNNPFQKWQSEYAEKAFLSAIKSADIIFYNGHSRYGGGPDFGPPILSAHKTPSKSYYQKHRPGFEKMVEALNERSERGKGATTVGLYSCVSEGHFGEALKKAKVKLISTNHLIHYSESLDESLKDFSKMLPKECD